ncbi:MAG: DUF86 domain-containing protein [Candidatus Wallbacteria bacterium]|nr:DUF86 domain-containing protein [Candidatus Wallbacteria bacterium]
MLPEERNAAFLWDMLSYCREIIDTTKNLSFEEYMGDRNLRLATERRIEIIGQAAGSVSESFRRTHPEIPWAKIIAQRNILAHEYGEIKQELVFRLAIIHIPELAETLQNLLPD